MTVHRLGFDKSEVHVFCDKGPRTMSLDEAADLDIPEGSVVVHLSATLFRRLVRYRDAAMALASPDDDDS